MVHTGGGLMINNVVIETQSPLNYKAIYINHIAQLQLESLSIGISNQLREFHKTLVQALIKVGDFLKEQFKEASTEEKESIYLLSLNQQLNLTKKYLVEDATVMIDKLVELVHNIDVKEKDYEFMSAVINNQESLVKELIQKEINTKRAEMLLQLLNEIPLYLKYDLQLTEYKKKQELLEVYMEVLSKTKTNITYNSYDIQEKDQGYYSNNAYKIIA
ncbi:hypothetical protein [Priestia aryabhattai]